MPLVICGTSMVCLKSKVIDKNQNNNSSHPGRIEVAAGSLAVVVELPALVDVQPVQAEAELKHCPPQLCQAVSVEYC